MENDMDCLEYRANDEFVFYPGAVVTESSANIKCSRRSKVSNLKPIPTTLTHNKQIDCDLPTIVGSARSVSPLIPQEVIELLPIGLRNLSVSDENPNKNSAKCGHRRNLSHNYDYLHDLVTCDAIQVLSNRPSHLPSITRSALSSVDDNYRSDSDCNSGERSGESSTTNSLNSTSSMSVDSSNSFTDGEQYTLYNDEPQSMSVFDDYDNFTSAIENNIDTVKHVRPMGIHVTDYSENYSNINFHKMNEASSNDNSDLSCTLNTDSDFLTQNDEIIWRECRDFIDDNSSDLSSLSDAEENNSQKCFTSQQCSEPNCNSIYDNVLIGNKYYAKNINSLETKFSSEPIGRPPCSPLKGRRSASPRRRVDSSNLGRRDIPRRAIRQKNPRTKSVHENQRVENGFQKNKKQLIESMPNDDHTKKEKLKNKSLYHYVKKLLG